MVSTFSDITYVVLCSANCLIIEYNNCILTTLSQSLMTKVHQQHGEAQREKGEGEGEGGEVEGGEEKEAHVIFLHAWRTESGENCPLFFTLKYIAASRTKTIVSVQLTLYRWFVT